MQVLGPGGVGTFANAVALARGTFSTDHMCAVRNDDTVWCWGENFRGQLGDGTVIDKPYPVNAI